jgi:hypothetical protein
VCAPVRVGISEGSSKLDGHSAFNGHAFVNNMAGGSV